MAKRIVYTASDSGIDGMGPREIVYASYDETRLKKMIRTDKNKNWLTFGEQIVDVDAQKRKSLAKLDALDKLVIDI